MGDNDRTANCLDNAYVLSFFFELAALIAACIGLVWWASDRTSAWGLGLLVGAAAGIVACRALRWYIKRCFRRRWPIE